ncbi:hypothetical protein [Flavobacterium acetivorans]|uniref:hypothetical protein n=1 Tax=Flavobacterium acetivorans TaxID=2893883 RepID=UPI001E28D6EE|nr:hypothetical protein [Flavobacterium sp. F-29]UFH35581.1 hypothetical protein LNP19_00660 [Flavobacterium sp. F-29]
MKKITLTAVALFIFGLVTAQDKKMHNNGGQTSEGKWLIEANTGFGGGTAAHSANTGFGFTTTDGNTEWSIGAEAGYFVINDLAIKAGLGYSSVLDGDVTSFTYKVGAKYYISSMIPVQVDLTGASWKDAGENPLWLGIQGGYAIFLGDNVSIEPGLRYNVSLNEDFYDKGIFEVRVGFALHF